MEKAAWISIWAGILILALKWVAYRVSGSLALQSDAIEGIVNIVAAMAALSAVRIGGKPADQDHPYGHGKAEHFSAALEGLLISLAAAVILTEAFSVGLQGREFSDLNLGMALNFVAGLGNGALGFYLIRAGRKLKSHAIEADGQHVLSDFYTTIGLLLALAVVRWTGWLWLDSAIAVVIGVILGWTGLKLLRRAFGALLDTEDPQVVSELVAAMEKVRSPDIIAVHALRTLRSGAFVHADVHVVIPEFYDIGRGHDLVESFGEKFLATAGHTGEAHTHMDPCARRYCESCWVAPCPIRRARAVTRVALLTEDPDAPAGLKKA